MACDTDLSSGTIVLEDKIFERYEAGSAPNTVGGVTLKIRNDPFKGPCENLQNTLKEHCVLVSHTTPTTSTVPDGVDSNTYMLKLSDHQVVHSKLRRRKYSQYTIPVPGTVLSSVPQISKLSRTDRDCVKSVNSTTNILNPDDRHGEARSESGTSCLSSFHNSEQVHMTSQCGSRTTLTEERSSPPLSGNESGSHLQDDNTGDSHCSEFISSDVKTDDLQKTRRHLDSDTRPDSSMSHQQQPVRKQEADQVVIKPAEQRSGGDHSGKVGPSHFDIAKNIETEVPWQEEVLKPYCDCQISSFTDDMARACSISYQGFPVRLPHVGSVLIQEHQLATFARNGKTYVSVCELKSKNMIHNFTKFTSLLESRSSLLPLAQVEVEFLKQKGRVKDTSNAELVSLGHLRWIYRTQAGLQKDAFNTAVSQCPWYSVTLGHSCHKVAMLNLTQDYVCPVCFRVEQRPIEATTQRYECDLCFEANGSLSVPQSQMPNVKNYANKTQKMEKTSFVVREDGKLQTVIMGHIKVGEKNVAAFCKGDVTFVSCRHLLVHLYQFPWENFLSLVKSLDLSFMEAPVKVCHFFQKLAYPQELVNGRVWCSVQNLRCIACFSVGQMNNTQYLEKNKILALIAQGKYVEEFPFDTRDSETEKSVTEPKRVLPSHKYQVHKSQVSTTNSSAKKVVQAPLGKTVVKVDAATGQILVCRDNGKTVGCLSLPQTSGQASMQTHDQRDSKLNASNGQRVVSDRVKIVGNLCQTLTVAKNRIGIDDQMGLSMNARVGQSLVRGGDGANVGDLSRTQTVAQNNTKQKCVNFDGSGQIVVVGNTTTSTRPTDTVNPCISGLTQSNPDEWSPIMPPSSVVCCERSQIPGGNYFVKENMNFTDYESESGLVFRVMKHSTVKPNKVDILSIAAKEIKEVASKSENTSDMNNSGLSNTNDSSCNKSFQSTSFDQCSNVQQLTSEKITQPQSVQGTVCTDFSTVQPAPTLSVDMCDNNPYRLESDSSEGQDKLLSMPVNFFQDSPVGTPKRKCFLSPDKIHEVTKRGGDVIVFQNESGEHYECTALGPIDELNDCLLVVSPAKAEKENPKTISPDSACSQKSVDSGISEGKLCTSVGPGHATSLNQSQYSNVCGEDNSSSTKQSGSGRHSEPLPAKCAKNIQSKTEQTSQVTSSLDEEYKPDTSGVFVPQGICLNVSQSSETKETEPSNMSPIKSDTQFSSPTRLSVNSPNKSPFSTPTRLSNSPNKSPVIANIYKKLVTRSNPPSSLSVLASVAEAIDEDGHGKDVGADGGSCKVKSVTVDNQSCNETGSVVPEKDSVADGRSNIADNEATDGDAKESTPLLQETQSSANNSIFAEDEDMNSESEEESSPQLQETQSDFFPEDESSVCHTDETSPLLQAKWNNTEIFPHHGSSVCDTEENSSLLKETESDIFTEHDVSPGNEEECLPLLQAKWNVAIISEEDETVGKLAKCRNDKSSHSDCCSVCSLDERLSASDTDHLSSADQPHGGDSRSPGTSNSSIENELDLHLKSLKQNQTLEKSSSVSEEQLECSEDVGKCLAQKEDVQMSTEEVLESDLLCHQDPAEGSPSVHKESEERNTSHLSDPEEKSPHHYQGPEDKASWSGLDASGNVDTDVVMDDSCHQLQIAEEIEENNSGNSIWFQGETEGTDLCHGGSVEPDTVVGVSSVEPETAVGISSVDPETVVGVSSVDPDTAVGVSSVEPDTAVGVSSVEPDTAVGVSSVEPDTVVGVSSVDPETAVGVSSVDPETVGGVSSVDPETAVGVSSVEPDTAVGVSSVEPDTVVGVSSVDPETAVGVSSVEPETAVGVSSVEPETAVGVSSVEPETAVGVSSVDAETVVGVSSVEPETAVGVSSVDAETVVGVSSVEPETAVGVSSVDAETVVGVSSVEPETAVGVSSVDAETVVGVSSVEPETAVGVSSVEPETVVGVSSVEPETAVGVSSVEPETAVGVSSVEPETVVGVNSVEPKTAVSSVEPNTAVERKSKKRKRRQSLHKRVKRKKTIMSEVETTGLSTTSSCPSSKGQSNNVTVAAESPVFSVCDNNQDDPVEGSVFSETDKLPRFTRADNHQRIPDEGALFSECTENELVTAKSPRFSSGGKDDHISTETMSPLEGATKDHIADEGSETALERQAEHAVEQMKRVLEKVQVDELVVADNRLQFKLKLHPSLHTHFRGETQRKLVDRLSQLVKIGHILQQRRQTAD